MKKNLSLNKLVISKLTNPSSIMGGSEVCTAISKGANPPVCPPPPPPQTIDNNCTFIDTHMDC